MASRPEQALIWGQAGGSLRTDSAGVWWASMSFSQRFNDPVFINNQNEIEKDWDSTYGDRKNEIVFIGQNLDERLIRTNLDACLSTHEELGTQKWERGYEDNWPIQRMNALK